MAMPRALQLRGVRKRFLAGVDGCLASADVLRGVDLDLDSGESVAVIGAPGSGKSTLFLCAAGLLRADAGTCSWFGDPSPISAATRAHYCFSSTDLTSIVTAAETRIYFVDLPPTLGTNAALADWIADRCEAGNAVLLAARDERLVPRTVDRILILSGGVLQSARTMRSRVAESVAAEALPFC